LPMEPAAVTGADVERDVVETLRSMASVPDAVSRDAALSEVDIDSLDLVELTQVIEDSWGVALEAGDLSGVETVGQVVDFFVAQVQ
jgi:acyl carrier protein